MHQPISTTSSVTSLALPSDVSTLPRAAVRARFPVARRVLDVFVHVVTEGTSTKIVGYAQSGTPRWSRPFTGEHAASACGRNVYVVFGDRLEALAVDTGATRWSMTIEGDVVRLATIGCDALIARRARGGTTEGAEVLHVLGAEGGATKTEVPCESCFPRAIAEDTFVWSEPTGVRVLDARANALRLHVLRMPDDDVIKGRAGDALITYDEGELAAIRLDEGVLFRKRGRVRVLAVADSYVLTLGPSSIEALDPATGLTRTRFNFAASMAPALEDVRGVALEGTNALIRMSEPLSLEAVLDVSRGTVLTLRALPFAVEATYVRGRNVLHGGAEWVLTDALSMSAPIRAQLSRQAERAALVSTIARLSDEDPYDFTPRLVGLGRCAFEERPAMRLALLDAAQPSDDGSFADALARAILADINLEGSGGPLLGDVLARLPANVHMNTLIALTAWLTRDDALLEESTYTAWLRAATTWLAGARFEETRSALTSEACRGSAVPETCLRAEATIELARNAYAHAARRFGDTPIFVALENAIAVRAGAPLAGASRTAAILRTAARGYFAFDPRAISIPMTSSTAFDFPTAFGVRVVSLSESQSCGFAFSAPRNAIRMERGSMRGAYAVRISDTCADRSTVQLVTPSGDGFVYRGEANARVITH